MSRIGKNPIPVPEKVEVKIDGRTIEVKGPKGTLSRTVSPVTSLSRDEDGAIVVTRANDEREARAMHGLTRSLIENMVIGVTEGYEKKMEIFGVGYRVLQKGKNLEFSLGYSHPIVVEAPEGITFTTDGATKFAVSGIDKQLVGQVAANIRRLRKTDPYKGKGIRYEGEHIRRTVGKAGK